MNSKPIHEMSAAEIDRILKTAANFSEWDIEPNCYQLGILANSIKASVNYFFPDFKIYEVKSIFQMNRLLETFSKESDPINRGLRALKEIHKIINSNGQGLLVLTLNWVINDFLEALKPYILDEKLKKYQAMQSKKAKKPRTRSGLTPEQRQARNAEIVEKWRKNLEKKDPLLKNSFAANQAKKYNLSISAIKDILKTFSK